MDLNKTKELQLYRLSIFHRAFEIILSAYTVTGFTLPQLFNYSQVTVDINIESPEPFEITEVMKIKAQELRLFSHFPCGFPATPNAHTHTHTQAYKFSLHCMQLPFRFFSQLLIYHYFISIYGFMFEAF